MQTIGKSVSFGKIKKMPSQGLLYTIIQDGPKISILAKFCNVFGLNKQLIILPYFFQTFNSCYRTLFNAGYPWPKDIDKCKKLHQSWLDSGPNGWLVRALEPGWCLGHFEHYLLPNTRTLINGRRYLYSAANNIPRRLITETNNDWLKLSRYIEYSPLLVLGASLLFGSTLLPATNLPNSGFYLSSKIPLNRLAYLETIAAIAGGRGSIPLRNMSRSEIETIACDCNHFSLCSEYLLAEPKLARQLPDMVSWLASSRHRLSFTLVGDQPLSGVARHSIKGLIGLPLDCDPEFGICDSLPPDCASSADLLKRVIKLAQNRSYSWVLAAFTTGITTHWNDASLRGKVLREMAIFMRAMKISDPVEWQFAAIFALAFAGIVIASELKLVSWSRQKIGSSIAQCYRIARGEMIDATTPVRLTDEDIDQLRSRLRGPTVKTLLWNGNKPGWTIEEAQNAEAFLRKEPHPAGYLVSGAMLLHWFGPELAKLLTSFLKEQGFLISEANRQNTYTYQCQIHGVGTHRYYVIDPSFINPSDIKHNPTINS